MKPPSFGSEKVIQADPLLVLAIISLPLLALLTLSVVVVPLIPIVIYLFAAFGPGVAPAGRRRRKRATSSSSSSSSRDADDSWLMNSSIFRQVNEALNGKFIH